MLADRVVLTAVIAALSLPSLPDADACGRDFPIELLADREDAMSELPEGVFLDEVTRLVSKPGDYAVVPEEGDDAYVDDDDDTPAPSPPPSRWGPPSSNELALYQRGVAYWDRNDPSMAADLFEEVLALPPGQRRHRSTRAAYMLGRIDREGRGASWYRKVRELADDGYVDDLGLAASSLGQEARLHEDPVARITLYAQQAALGHRGGALSLLFVVRDLVDRGEEDAILGAPVGQKLVAAYLDCRGDELSDAQRTRVWERFARIPAPAGADHLAAAAYRERRFDDAARLVAGAADTATARWVSAKLALRAGDRATGARLLAAAERRLVDTRGCEPDHWGPYGYACGYDPRARLHAERAIVALADGRYPDAMQHAWDARRSYRDAVFIAERVLTPDELLAFLAALPADVDDGIATLDLDDPATGGPSTQISRIELRNVYARRLMRAGRYRDAIPYLSRAYRTAAIAFAASMEDARATGDPIAKARALHDASTIARRDGLEILGTEHGPDWALYGASSDLTEDGVRGAASGRWAGPGERLRVSRSRPAFPRRYHYRYVASQLAEDAADHLPERSQAFATTLCDAARYVRNVDEDRVQALYRRYVADGPMVSMDFGRTCPDPEIERARRFLPKPGWPAWAYAVPPIAIALAAAGALLVLRRRRQRRFAARP